MLVHPEMVGSGTVMMTSTTTADWDQALEHHLAGRLPAAAAIYRRLLAASPVDARVLHMLGMLQFQQGDAAAGLAMVDRAIAIEPGLAKYHGHRGLILAAMGNADAAITAYQTALTIEPRASNALNNLGIALFSKGDWPGAIDAYRRALEIEPGLVEAATNLGLALIKVGRNAEAVQSLENALAQRPSDLSIAASLATAWSNRGVEFERDGNPQEAIAAYSRAISLKADFAEAHFNLGKTLASSDRDEEAIAAYGRAIALKPEMADAHNNLGIVLCKRGRIQEAIASYRETLRLRPNDVRALNNLGSALRTTSRLTDAIVTYRRALELEPSNPGIWSNLGCALDTRGELSEAIAAFNRAIELAPKFSEFQNNLGNALKNAGDLDGALLAYQRALEINPANQSAHSNRLYTLYYHPGYSPPRILQEHLQWNATHAAPLRPMNVPRPGGSTSRRLRIGYVGAYFREHCQSFFTMPLFSNHNREQFEVIAYSDAAAVDSTTARLRGFCNDWRNIAGLPDQAVADLVRQDRIDILVDLSLHMADNRLLVFARRPAPLQVTWLGYPGTTGLDTIDYRLTDPYLDPPSAENDACYSEKSYRLPSTFWCYDPLTNEPAVSDLPASRNGYVTFGCLNNFCKITEPTLRLWAAVLRTVPNSRLLLLAPRIARPRIIESLGIAADRIEFVDRQSRKQYMATYHRIDISLDTIPYNGHTTTLDSLWMGVPVVTLIGDWPAGRAGWSQLNNLSLQNLAATSPEQFVQTAAKLAGNSGELSALRRSLRDRLTRSPLMDGARFARDMEAAYQTMWRASNNA
jgi:predicted O-linked N-acetylglucosamine transferase (SPINDLY family)